MRLALLLEMAAEAEEWLKRATRDLTQMVPFSPEQMEKYVLSKGWFAVDKDGALKPGQR